MRKINLTASQIKQAADCLRVIAHPVRLQLIQILLHKECSVGELAESCRIAHNLASTHLKLLERCGLLSSTRKGRFVEYKAKEKHLEDLLSCIEKHFK